MNDFPNLKNPIHFIATLGGVGKISFIFSFLLFILLSHYIDMHAVVFFSILFSVWICEKASADLIEKDHSSIVIDELAGMWVALLPALYMTTQSSRTTYAILAFIFFRIFDIWKPFPISYFDKNYKNGFGIVLDDVIAGILAIIPALFLIYLGFL